MPWQALYSAQGVEVRFDGPVTAQEIEDANAALYAHAYAEGLRYQLGDFSAVTAVDVRTADVLRIADQDQRLAPQDTVVHIALVAPQPLTYGLGRMWQTYVETAGIDVRVCRSRAEALDWLRSRGVTVPAGP
jgi:hypothetical protein